MAQSVMQCFMWNLKHGTIGGILILPASPWASSPTHHCWCTARVLVHQQCRRIGRSSGCPSLLPHQLCWGNLHPPPHRIGQLPVEPWKGSLRSCP